MKLDPETLKLINGEIDMRLSNQREMAARVDVKAAGLLTLLLASVPLGLWSTWSWVLFPARLLVVLAAMSVVTVFTVRSYWDAPVPRALVEKYVERPMDDLLEVLVGTKVEAFERNARLYSRKTRWWRISVVLLVATGVALLAGYGVTNWSLIHGQ